MLNRVSYLVLKCSKQNVQCFSGIHFQAVVHKAALDGMFPQIHYYLAPAPGTTAFDPGHHLLRGHHTGIHRNHQQANKGIFFFNVT